MTDEAATSELTHRWRGGQSERMRRRRGCRIWLAILAFWTGWALPSALAQKPNVSSEAGVVVVNPDKVVVNHFDGWGISLCWWANVVGGYPNRELYADLAFTYLRLNIVRYNIGGGENPRGPETLKYRATIPGFEPRPGYWEWQADANQRWMLRAALARGVTQVDAFANSPPYWMTLSGSVTGGYDGGDNLGAARETDFASYLVEVLAHLAQSDGIRFHSITPMNEPSSDWWRYGNSQEGCHMNAAQQSRMVEALHGELEKRGLHIAIAAAEENSERSGVLALEQYSPAALERAGVLVTHTYRANDAEKLNQIAAKTHKPLGASEYGDGDATGMKMARRIHDDLVELRPAYWCYWQLVDSEGGWGMIYNPLQRGSSTEMKIHEKLYVMAQYSRFVRPGCQIIDCGDDSSLATYDPARRSLIVVALNDSPVARKSAFDLGAFVTTNTVVQRFRTSARENMVPLKDAVFKRFQFSSVLPAESVTTHILTGVQRKEQ